MLKVFICYRRKDSAGYAGRLAESLARSSRRYRVFIDVHIPAGNDFHREIENGVKSCDVVLALIGPSWLNLTDDGGARRLEDPKDHLRLEIEFALRNGVRVIPVLVGGAKVPADDQLPEALRALTRYQAIELSDERWEHDLARLTQAFGLSTWDPRTVLLVAAAVLVVGVVGYAMFSGGPQATATNPAQPIAKASAEVLGLSPEPSSRAPGSATRETAVASAPAPEPSAELSARSAVGAVSRALAGPPRSIYKPPPPARVRIAKDDHVWLYQAASGLKIAFVEPKSTRAELHFPGLRLFVGRDNTFEELPIVKTEADGQKWLVEFNDVRTSYLPEGKISVTEENAAAECGTRKLELVRIAADATTSALAVATFWDYSREGSVLALGQGANGEYTLVQSLNDGFVVFRGTPKKMRRVALLPSSRVERKSPAFGFAFPTPEGTLHADRTPLVTFKLTWQSESSSETLVELSPTDNWKLIFESLGVYPAGRFYSTCADLDEPEPPGP